MKKVIVLSLVLLVCAAAVRSEEQASAAAKKEYAEQAYPQVTNKYCVVQGKLTLWSKCSGIQGIIKKKEVAVIGEGGAKLGAGMIVERTVGTKSHEYVVLDFEGAAPTGEKIHIRALRVGRDLVGKEIYRYAKPLTLDAWNKLGPGAK